MPGARSPGWFLQVQSQSADLSEQGAGEDGRLAPCSSEMVKYCIGPKVSRGAACLASSDADALSAVCKSTLAAMPVRQGGGGVVPRCSHSPLCSNTLGGDKTTLAACVEWKQTGRLYLQLPVCTAGRAWRRRFGRRHRFQEQSVGLPAQRARTTPAFQIRCEPQADPRTVGEEDVIGHQLKAHGVKVDAQDNVSRICDADGSTVMKISPEGKLLMTLPAPGAREATGTRPRARDCCGSRWTSPSPPMATSISARAMRTRVRVDDTDSRRPRGQYSVRGARRPSRSGRRKFVNQWWYGNSWGPGKFESVHGIGVDPKTGNVWLGDRDQYRLVVDTGEGKFIKISLSMKNLTHLRRLFRVRRASSGSPRAMMASSSSWDQNGNTVVAVGNGRGTGPGQFMETNFMAMDTHGNLYTGRHDGCLGHRNGSRPAK